MTNNVAASRDFPVGNDDDESTDELANRLSYRNASFAAAGLLGGFLLVMFAMALSAQTVTTSTIIGTVTDRSAFALVIATVTVEGRDIEPIFECFTLFKNANRQLFSPVKTPQRIKSATESYPAVRSAWADARTRLPCGSCAQANLWREQSRVWQRI